MATFSMTYNPDQHGPSGPGRGAEDYNLLEESCEHGRHTLAGIDERAAIVHPYNAANRNEYRLDLLHDAVAAMFGTWADGTQSGVRYVGD